jgi:hypothetical protein
MASVGAEQNDLDLELQIDVFNAAGVIFCFFLPLSCREMPTAGKFWGAIEQLFSVSRRARDIYTCQLS